MNGLNLAVGAHRRCEAIAEGLREFGGDIEGFLDKMGYASSAADGCIVRGCLALWVVDGGADVGEFLDRNGYTAREVRFIAKTAIQQFSKFSRCARRTAEVEGRLCGT